MATSFNKKEVQKKKQEKKLEKQKRKEERKAHGSDSFEDMIAYVDANGMIVDTPPDPIKKDDFKLEDIEVSIPKKEDEEPVPLEGVVEFFNAEKGYGFIRQNDNMYKYFFHISSAPDTIKEGNKVRFELERGQRGMNAVRITLAN